MKKILLVLFMALGLNAQSQISITQAEMPASGDELYRTRANLNLFLNYGATGANHTWNFGSLVANTQDSAVYQSVSSTNFVYALIYADIFFNPNRANHARSGVDIPFNNLLPITDPYTFFYRSSSIYKKVGYGAEIAGIPLPIIYSDHDEIYNLPINYGDNDSSFSSYNISIPALAYYGYEQSRLNDVDGWGVITTPSGTYDALRVKTTLVGKDSIQLDSLNLGFAINRPVVKEYKWLSPSIRIPVLQVNTSTIFGIELITDIYFYDAPRTLTVTAPLATTICPGNSVQVNYTVTGTFNPGGFLSLPNVFRAQLSDINGNFAAPITIGSVTSTQSGTINATIPANTPIGTGYRIRVIATNPAFTGDDNGFDLTVGSAPVSSISAAGSLSFCNGDSVILSSVTDPGYTYQWQLNGSDLSGAINPDLTAMTTGNYTMVVTNACGTSTSAPISVIVNDLPEHTFATTAYISCNGSGATISSTNQSGQSSLTYQWYLDGNLLAGETNPDITSNLQGNYTLEIINSLTGCVFTTSAVSLTDEVVAEPVLSASSATTFCEGDSVLLQVVPEPGISYQWFVDGVSVSGATASTLTAVDNGNYTVEATSVNGCTSVSVSGISVIVNSLPLVPVISSNGPVTFCQGGSVQLELLPEPGVTYQWQLDGIDIPNAINSSLQITTPGNYSVNALNASGCANSSAVTTVVVNPLPVSPVITANGSTTFCDGGSVVLEVPLVSGINYQWTLGNVDIVGATSNQYTVTSASGFYSVNVTDQNGCVNIATISYQVTVNPLPSIPVITQSYDTLFSSGTGPFQWYLDGVLLTGETSSTLIVLANGNYTVMVTDVNGCESISAILPFTSVGISESAEVNISVYPNPSNGLYNIQLNSLNNDNGMFEVSDVSGKMVQTGFYSDQNFTIDIREKAEGIYILRLKSALLNSTLKISKQ